MVSIVFRARACSRAALKEATKKKEEDFINSRSQIEEEERSVRHRIKQDMLRDKQVERSNAIGREMDGLLQREMTVRQLRESALLADHAVQVRLAAEQSYELEMLNVASTTMHSITVGDSSTEFSAQIRWWPSGRDVCRLCRAARKKSPRSG